MAYDAIVIGGGHNGLVAACYLGKAGKSRKKLVNFNDGAVTVADFAKWIQAEVANPVEGPQQLESMKQLPDSTLEMGVTQLAQRYLFLGEAERAIRVQALGHVEIGHRVCGIAAGSTAARGDRDIRRRRLRIDEELHG